MFQPACREAVAAGRRPPKQPNSPSSAEITAACHECIALVNARPELWPMLNRLTLTERPDWIDVLRQLHAAGP